MATARSTVDAAKELESTDLVEVAWAADRGFVIAILERSAELEGSVFETIDRAERLEFDGEIQIQTDFMHQGEERTAAHFIARDR